MVDPAFAKQFEREVHEAYCRQGSKLRATVRVKNDVRGPSTIFQQVGKGGGFVEAFLDDTKAGEWVRSLDDLKINTDERMIFTSAGAYGLGRKTDGLILDALDGATQIAGRRTDGLSHSKALAAFHMLGDKNVPDDGQRFAVIGWKQWADLLALPGFASADFVCEHDLPWKGSQAKNWLGTVWIPHSGLPLDSGVRACFWFHRSAVGHAIGGRVITEFSWHEDRGAHFISNSMPQGAALIDGDGVVKMPCREAA